MRIVFDGQVLVGNLTGMGKAAQYLFRSICPGMGCAAGCLAPRFVKARGSQLGPRSAGSWVRYEASSSWTGFAGDRDR